MQGLDKFPPAVVLWVVAYGLHVQAGKGGGVQCDRPVNHHTTQARGRKMERAGKDGTKGCNEQAGEGKEAGY